MIEVTDKYTLSLLGVMIRTNNFKKLGRPMLVHFSCERMDDNVGSFLTGGKLGKWFARRVMGNYNFPNFDYHIANSTYTAEEFYESAPPGRQSKTFVSLSKWCWRFFKAPAMPFGETDIRLPSWCRFGARSRPDRSSDEVEREMLDSSGIPEESITIALCRSNLSRKKYRPAGRYDEDSRGGQKPRLSPSCRRCWAAKLNGCTSKADKYASGKIVHAWTS